jgi:CrcB protein
VDYVWVGVGAVLGANARFALGRWLDLRYGTLFPYGTFVVNVTGAFLLGLLLALLTGWLVADPRWRLLLGVGFLGSYTTFSTYTYEAVALAERGDWARAALYVLGSNALGLLACLAGLLLGRAVAG